MIGRGGRGRGGICLFVFIPDVRDMKLCFPDLRDAASQPLTPASCSPSQPRATASPGLRASPPRPSTMPPPPLPLHLLFLSRASCAICTNARATLAKVWQKRPFEYTEIDVMLPSGAAYRAYEFDVPVIQVSRVTGGEHGAAKHGDVLWERMHKICESEILDKLSELERQKSME